jgi:group I intron endonuclease
MIIYKITNIVNGKIYIGQSRNTNKYYFGGGSILKKAIKKYGKSNFIKETIEECNCEKCLEEREIFWIKELDSRNPEIGYNIREGGGLNGGHYDIQGENNPNYGNKWTDEAKQKASDRLKGHSLEEIYGLEKANEVRNKMSISASGVNNSMYGISPEKRQCYICNKIVDIRNYNRWHGEKCRGVDFLTREDKQKLKKENNDSTK